MTDEIHDHSRLDGYLRARQKVALLNAAWRPMAAGAVGAALVIGAVYVTLPKFTVREVIVPAITMRDTVVPNIVQHDVQVDHIVPHDVPVEIPRIIVTQAPLTPAERDFTSRPEYQAAEFHGRIVRSVDGRALSFEGGKDFWPAHIDPATGKGVLDPQAAFDAAPFIGDFGMCVQDKTDDLWNCSALHEGREQPIVYKQGRPT